MVSPYREAPKDSRSLGTIRPPAVTRSPGGLPCSLRSFSAFPRLIDGEGDGLLYAESAAGTVATTGRRLLVDALLARFADADTEGRRTCSEQLGSSAALSLQSKWRERKVSVRPEVGSNGDKKQEVRSQVGAKGER